MCEHLKQLISSAQEMREKEASEEKKGEEAKGEDKEEVKAAEETTK
tara:strand:- start:143 stop:280 length:138 start_codon:yes stop_codon:yes gene_type:complete